MFSFIFNLFGLNLPASQRLVKGRQARHKHGGQVSPKLASSCHPGLDPGSSQACFWIPAGVYPELDSGPE